MRVKKIKEILGGFFPLKKLGQNFLINEKILDKIVATANINVDDTVLEVGPGFGNLTKKLAKKAKRVLAIEKDKRMIKAASYFLKDFRNIKIIEGDILKIKISDLKIKGKYKVVANLPYYISAPTIRNFLEEKIKPKLMVLMVQKELAQRIVAKPPKMNLLAVSVQFYAKAKIVFLVKKHYFWPEPKVDGAVIKIEPFCSQPKINPSIFFKIVKIGFLHPRKQIINNLTQCLKSNKIKLRKLLFENKISPTQRPENLNIKKWIKISKILKPFIK